MFSTNAFDYINILDRAADASWLRNEAISNNIANATTPGYKRQDVSFAAELRRALGSGSDENMDERVRRAQTRDLTPTAYTDSEGYSYRLDGNNVDIDTENVYLAENQLMYQGLLSSITAEFQNLQAVMK